MIARQGQPPPDRDRMTYWVGMFLVWISGALVGSGFMSWVLTR